MNLLKESIILESNKRQALIAFLIAPVILGLILISGILLWIFSIDVGEGLTYISLIFISINSLFFISEFILRYRKKKAEALLKNNDYDNLFKLIGRPPAPFLINNIIRDIDNPIINQELLLLIKESRNENKLASAIAILGMRGEKAKNILDELKEILDKEKRTYVLIYLHSTIAILEGYKSDSLNVLREMHNSDKLKRYIDTEDIYTYTLDKLIDKKQMSNSIKVTESQNLTSEQDFQNMVIAHQNTTRRLITGLKTTRARDILIFFIGSIVGALISYGITWLIDFIRSI